MVIHNVYTNRLVNIINKYVKRYTVVSAMTTVDQHLLQVKSKGQFEVVTIVGRSTLT